jgi:hypothetical protein
MNMKKLILLASLCIAGFVVAPVASASAATFVGSCAIKGTAVFGAALPKTEPLLTTTYTFDSEAGTTCSGVIIEGTSEVTVNEANAKAHVEGKGELSCLRSKSTTSGNGSVTIKGKTAVFTGFEFVGVGVNVTFTINGGESLAGGTASFAADTKGVKQCAEPGVLGPTHLEFAAAAKGKLG